ncbi:MAG: hypothetical protein S4CHLAM27_10760 [Chlamydiia bacterium]|nr:hypothetical protein [Chlamydiia bacterium]
MADGKITVDNYPIDYSVQYEKNRSHQDENLLEDAQKVRHSVSRDTFEPNDTLAVDEMFGNAKKSDPWGASRKPNDKGYGSGNTFSTGQISPTFGPQHRLDAMADRVKGIRDEKTKERSLSPQGDSPPQGPSSEISDEENGADKILSMLDVIGKINKSIEYVHGEIARFQKG